MNGDYEANTLLDESSRFLNTSKIIALTYRRQFIAYSSRLFFGIGWSIMKSLTDVEEERIIYDQLLFRRNRRPGDSIEPGELCTILQTLVKRHGNLLNDPVKNSLINGCIKYLSHAGNIRNVNYGHEISDLEYKPFFERTEKLIEEYQELLSPFICEYLIPDQTNVVGSIMKYYVLGAEDRSASRTAEIPIPEDIEHPQDKLLYRLTSAYGPYLFCLSPFITMGAPEKFILSRDPHFYLFEKLINPNYANGYMSIAYQKTLPTITYVQGKPDSVFEKDQFEIRLSDLFIHKDLPSLNGSDVWYGHSKPYINLSQYPGFDKVVANQYAYCDEICPIRNNVMRFCEGKNCNKFLYVFGNGGLGKTALMLSVLNELLNTRSSHFLFTNLIFLSAKKRIYTNDKLSHLECLVENSADIDSYSSFIDQMTKMLGGLSDESDVSAKRDYVLHCLSEYRDKHFLLIIDDFDSLSMEDQMEIEQFINDDNSGILKTIITTRFIYPQDAWHVKLNELDDESSLKFAIWYRNKYGPSDWNSWENHINAERAIKMFGKGNPLMIKKLVALIAAGLDFQIGCNATEREAQKYFHNTLQNLLDNNQKILFEICRRIVTKAPEENRTQDIPISLPRFLYAGTGLEITSFDAAFQRLKELTLIIQAHPSSFKFESPYILERDVVSVGNVKIPKMYKFIEERIENTPEDWFGYAHLERSLFNSIIASQSDQKSHFDSVVAMRILEAMQIDSDIGSTLKKEIEQWIAANNLVDHPEMQMFRLIEEIENKWDSLKDVFDSDRNDDEMQKELESMIKHLSSLLSNSPNRSIKDRLRKVLDEFGSYL